MSHAIARSPEVDAQLHAMALSTERSNRPRALILLPALLVVAGIVYLGVGLKTRTDATRRLARAATYDATIQSYVRAFQSAESEEIDFRELYPPNPYISPDIREALRASGVEFPTEPTIGQASSTTVMQEPRIVRTTVTCTVREGPLESILQWIEAIESWETLEGHAFISRLTLDPRPRGWQCSFDVSIYENR